MTPGDWPPDQLDAMLKRPDWQRYGACNGMDTEVFFPVRGESAAAAKEICACCGPRLACLHAALDNPEVVGIWGGTTGRERQRMRRLRVA